MNPLTKKVKNVCLDGRIVIESLAAGWEKDQTIKSSSKKNTLFRFLLPSLWR